MAGNSDGEAGPATAAGSWVPADPADPSGGTAEMDALPPEPDPTGRLPLGPVAGPDGGYPAPGATLEPLPEDEDWMAVPAARGLRLRVPTLILLALGLAAGGFWVGAVVQRHRPAQASTAAASRIAAFRALAGASGRTSGTGAGSGSLGGGGFGSGGFGAGRSTSGGAGPATQGTVTDVQGQVVYLTDSAGNLVKVDIGPRTTVTRTGLGAPGAVQIGDTALARGSKGPGGAVEATSLVVTSRDAAATSGSG